MTIVERFGVRLVVLGESTVQGGPWLDRMEQRYPDILARLLQSCLREKVRYHNAGVGASVISPASPGYEASAKPSAAERLDSDVIAKRPDILVVAYGLNDMRAGMPPEGFGGELRELIRRVRARCDPLIVLANVYHMTAWRSYPPFDKGNREATLAYNAEIRAVADAESCLYADVWRAQAERDWMIHQDGVHANVLGNIVIANEIFKVIAQNLPPLAEDITRRHANTDWTRHTEEWRRGQVEESDG